MRKMNKSERNAVKAGWITICNYIGNGWWRCVTYY